MFLKCVEELLSDGYTCSVEPSSSRGSDATVERVEYMSLMLDLKVEVLPKVANPAASIFLPVIFKSALRLSVLLLPSVSHFQVLVLF